MLNIYDLTMQVRTETDGRVRKVQTEIKKNDEKVVSQKMFKAV